MLGAIAKYVNDVSVLRKLLFAVANLPRDLPDLWEVAVEFATGQKIRTNSITATEAQIFWENLEELDALAFSTDRELQKQVIHVTVPSKNPWVYF